MIRLIKQGIDAWLNDVVIDRDGTVDKVMLCFSIVIGTLCIVLCAMFTALTIHTLLLGGWNTLVVVAVVVLSIVVAKMIIARTKAIVTMNKLGEE